MSEIGVPLARVLGFQVLSLSYPSSSELGGWREIPARVCSNFFSLLEGVFRGRDQPSGYIAVHRHSLDRLNAINDSLKKI